MTRLGGSRYLMPMNRHHLSTEHQVLQTLRLKRHMGKNQINTLISYSLPSIQIAIYRMTMRLTTLIWQYG